MYDYDASADFGLSDAPDTLPEVHPRPEGKAEQQAIDREDQRVRPKSMLDLKHELAQEIEPYLSDQRCVFELADDVMAIVWPQINNARIDQEKMLHRMQNLIYLCSSWEQACESNKVNLDQAVMMLEDIIRRTSKSEDSDHG
jgi:hypothetical protein